MAALLLAIVLWTIRPARIRYAAACLAILGTLAGFGLTYARVLSQQRAQRVGPAAGFVIPPPAGELGSVVLAKPTASFTPADILPWLAPFWMTGVLVFHLRSLAGWVSARRLCNTGVCCAPDV